MAERPLTFDEFLLLKQQEMAYAPPPLPPPEYVPPPPQVVGSGPPPPPPSPPPLMASPTPGQYAPPPYQGAVTQYEATPSATPPSPSPPTNFGYGPPTQEQQNAAIAAVAPPTSFGYGPPTRDQQRAGDPVYQASLTAEAQRQKTTTPTLSDADAQKRAESVLRTREQSNAAPWQEKLIPDWARQSFPGQVVNAALDTAGTIKDEAGKAGVISAIGHGLEAGATTAIKGASMPQQRLQEVAITRRYDELTKGNPDATFGAFLPSTVLQTTVINPVQKATEAATAGGKPGEFDALDTWLQDPANAGLIQTLFEQGYGGEQGYAAVYKYYEEQQGLGGIVSGITGDPFTYASLGVGSGKAVGTRLAAKGGKVATAGKAITAGVEAADLVLDPLKIPGAVRNRAVSTATRAAFDPVTGAARTGLAAKAGEKVLAADANLAAAGSRMSNALLTEAGRRGKTLDAAADSATNLIRASQPTAIPEPWLLERDAAGSVQHITDPMGNVRPLVRDLDTGVVRPVTDGDVTRALDVMRRLPYDRTGTNRYQQMVDDWIGLVTANRKGMGLGEEISTLYPSRKVPYQRVTMMGAERMKRYGQEVIDASYERMRNLANGTGGQKKDPVQAALLADRIQAEMEIAGVADLSAKKRTKEIARVRAAAKATGKYRKDATFNALMASGAKAPAGGTPMRLTFKDVVDVLDDDTRTFAEGTLSDGRVVGDVILEINQDTKRLQDLARKVSDGTISPWEQNQLDQLMKRYGHEFPTIPTERQKALQKIAEWRDFQRQEFASNQARRQIGIDTGYLDKKGVMIPTGIAGGKAFNLGDPESYLPALVRSLDKASATYKKYQLYNPLNILRYSGLQAMGNAVTLAVGDFGALPDYAKAITRRARNKGAATLDSPADQMMQAAGVGRSPFLKQGIKDELSRADFGNGPITSVLKAGRTFAGAFDMSLREAAYMHRFQPRYRALQMAQVKAAIDRARAMGVSVPEYRIEAAIQQLDALGKNAYRAWDAAQLKQALIDAARDPFTAVTPGAAVGATGTRKAVEKWAERVARDYANGVRTLHKDAIANVNRLGFAFDETKADTVLSRVFMYTQWSTRANLLYTREMLGNPALLNAYVNTWKTLDREGQKNNAPPWLRGFVQFMQTPMGLTVFGNPLALMNTFAIFNPEVLGTDYENPNLTDLGKLRQRSPFLINPIIDLLGLASGAYGNAAQPPNIMPVSFAKLYDWVTYWNAHSENPVFHDAEGNPTPPPWPLRYGLVGQEIPKRIAEAVSPLVAPALNSRGIPADVMQFGDAAASQRQDIVFMMLDVLAEQNPTLTQEQLNDLLVSEHAGGFDSADPVYQQALDRYSERAFAGILEGRDVPNAVRGLIDAASPFQRTPVVTARNENDAQLNGYFQAKEDADTYQDILAAQVAEPIRIGGSAIPPPSLFTQVEIGGTVVTPEDLAAMSPQERQEVADAWFAQRNPGYDPANIGEFPEAAYRSSQIAKAADPHDLALQEAEGRWKTPGTPEQNQMAATVNAIRYNDELPEGMTAIQVTIDGQPQTFDSADLKNMTEEERKDLAYLWLAEQPGGQEALDGFYAARAQMVADEPDLGGWKAMQEVAKGYPGGAEAWVREAIKENPTTYGMYANSLDPARYPEGSPDWVTEMTSLEAYQSLVQERPQSKSPTAWPDTPGAPVIPGLTGAANLNELYIQQQEGTAAENAEHKNRGDIVTDDLGRMSNVMALADQWDADHGYPAGTSRGLIVDQMNRGYIKGVNGIDYDLKELLDEKYPSIGEDGTQYPAIPTSEKSYTVQYVKWALQQPPDKRDPQIWARESLLKEELNAAAEQGVSVDATGAVTLNPEPTPPPPEDILAGYGVQRAVDGSGTALVAQEVTPQASWRVGGLGGTLYADPSTNSQALVALPPQMSLTTLQTQGDWVLVALPNGFTGWVRKRYLASDTPATAPPPAVSSPTTTPVVPTPTALPTATATPPPVVPTQTPTPLPQPTVPPKVIASAPIASPNAYTTAAGQTYTFLDPTGAPVTPNYGYFQGSTAVPDNPDGTRALPPKYIVYHYTATNSFDDFIGEFMGDTQRASSNYVLDKDGTLYTLVPPEYSAWANGDFDIPPADMTPGTNLNQESISIEIVNNGSEPYTPEQVATLQRWTAQMSRRYGITADHLIGHSDVTSYKSDPGAYFPWDLMRAAV